MLPQLFCLQIACQNLAIEIRKIDQNGNFVEINLSKFQNFKISKNNYFYFINSQTPFNNQDIAAICKDKFFTYKLLEKIVKQPQSWSFLDPNCANNYKEYLECQNFEEIAKKVLQKLSFPLILKPNNGSLGVNVQKIHNEKELKNGIAKIFDVNSRDYDYVLLAQEFVDIEEEFRVLVVNNKVELVYQKDNSEAEFVGNLSPLHWNGASVKIFENPKSHNLETEERLSKNRKLQNLVILKAENEVKNKDNYQNLTKILENRKSENMKNFLEKNSQNRLTKIEIEIQQKSEKIELIRENSENNFWQSLEKMIDLICQKMTLNWAGLDIVKMKNGELVLIEINTNPGFSLFLKGEIITQNTENFQNLKLQNPEILKNYLQKSPKHRDLIRLYTLALTKLQKQ